MIDEARPCPVPPALSCPSRRSSCTFSNPAVVSHCETTLTCERAFGRLAGRMDPGHRQSIASTARLKPRPLRVPLSNHGEAEAGTPVHQVTELMMFTSTLPVSLRIQPLGERPRGLEQG